MTPRPENIRHGSVWRRIRAEVLRASDVCWLCGKPGADSVDHLVPVSHGGDPYERSNLAPAHLLCNQKRGTSYPTKSMRLRSSRNW